MTTLKLILLFIALPLPLLAGDVAVTWDANSESDLAGYRLYYGTETGTYGVTLDVGNETSIVVENLTAEETYFFALTAYDQTGNESDFSNEVSVTIPPDSDTTAPTPPQNVRITSTENQP